MNKHSRKDTRGDERGKETIKIGYVEMLKRDTRKSSMNRHKM
jgi:hypothetical protein